MAPDAILPQELSLQWHLVWPKTNMSTVKMPAQDGYSPAAAERPAADPPAMVSPTLVMLPKFTMLQNLQKCLWGAVQRVFRRLFVAKELLSRTRLMLFLCSGYRAQGAMKGDEVKGTLGQGGEEEKVEGPRPDQTAAILPKTQMVEEEEEVLRRTVKLEVEAGEEMEMEDEDMEYTDDEEEEEEEEEEDKEESDWIEWGCEDGDDDEDEEAILHQQTVPTTGSCAHISLSLNCKQTNEDEENEDASDWSDDDDDDNSEASAESVELWESFLHSDDPYNPLSFSSCTASKASNSTHSSPVSAENRTDDWAEEEEEEEEEEENEDGQHSTHNIQQKKKVCFSDEVTVLPLVDWGLASREARDGSCWLEMARDRDRFRRRVEEAERVISRCLNHEHRRMVWEKLQKQSTL